MKAFTVTLVLFLILLLCGIGNFLFIRSVYREMERRVSEIPTAPAEENAAKIEEMRTYWEAKRPLVSISVSFVMINEVNDRIDSLSIYNEENDRSQFADSRQLLLNALKDITRLEEFSVENIF